MGDRTATALIGDIDGHVIAKLTSDEWYWTIASATFASFWADIYEDATGGQVLAEKTMEKKGHE
jgi:hypothetical protein